MALTTGQVATDLLIETPHKPYEYQFEKPSDKQAAAKQTSDKASQLEGLQSDVAKVTEFIKRVESGYTPTMQEMIQQQARIGSLKERKERFHKSRENIVSKSCGHEDAITSNGDLFLKYPNGTITKKNIRKMTKEEIPYVMTYDMLSREVSQGQGAFNDEMMDTLASATSASTASDHLRKIMKDVDYSTYGAEAKSGSGKETLDGYIKRTNMNALEYSKVDDNRVITAFNHSLLNMNENERNQLIWKSIKNTGTYNGDEAAIWDTEMFMWKNDIKKKALDDFDFNHFSAAKSNKRKTIDDMKRSITSNALALSMGLEENTLTGSKYASFRAGNTTLGIQSFEAQTMMNSKGTEWKEGKKLSDVLNGDSDKANAYLKGDIYLGNKRIRQEDTDHIGIANRRFAYIPFRKDDNGNFIPDFETVEQIDKIISLLNDTNMNNADNAIRKAGIKLRLNDRVGHNGNLTKDQEFAELDRCFEVMNMVSGSNAKPYPIPPAFRQKIIDEEWTWKQVLSNYFAMNYNENLTNNKFLIMPCDIGTAIAPSIVADAIGLERPEYASQEGRAYCELLSKMNYGDPEGSDGKMANANQELWLNFYKTNVSDKIVGTKPYNIDKNNLVSSIVILPYKHVSNVPYMMDFAQISESGRDANFLTEWIGPSNLMEARKDAKSTISGVFK